ncbi:hypothetical protein SHIRM173S_11971 [Streptomyces hirsutus]
MSGGTDTAQFSAVVVVGLLVLFYGGTFLISTRIGKREENADGYMTAGNNVGFGISAASMTATWIWASSMYASATSGYTYGISGPIHYGLWGALMILFIYPFGKRIRKVAPKAHTLAEVMYARHGRSSQLMLAGSNVVGSLISLMSNFIAGGVLISLLSPFNFIQGVVCVAAGVLLYTLWSGFRASVMTDFVQVVAMLGAVAVIVPFIFFAAGFPAAFETGADNLTPQQGNFFSSEAFMGQGAPYIAAVLAYAIGNQTIAQRLFAVKEPPDQAELREPVHVAAQQVQHVLRRTDRALDAPQRIAAQQLLQPAVRDEKLVGGGGEALAERGGLGRHVVRAAGHDQLAVLTGQPAEPGQHRHRTVPHQLQRQLDLQLLHVLGEVAGGHPLVHVLVPGEVVELLDPRLHVVPGHLLALRNGGQVDLVEDPLVVGERRVRHLDTEVLLRPQHGEPELPLQPHLLLGRPERGELGGGITSGEDVRDTGLGGRSSHVHGVYPASKETPNRPCGPERPGRTPSGLGSPPVP